MNTRGSASGGNLTSPTPLRYSRRCCSLCTRSLRSSTCRNCASRADCPRRQSRSRPTLRRARKKGDDDELRRISTGFVIQSCKACSCRQRDENKCIIFESPYLEIARQLVYQQRRSWERHEGEHNRNKTE